RTAGRIAGTARTQFPARCRRVRHLPRHRRGFRARHVRPRSASRSRRDAARAAARPAAAVAGAMKPRRRSVASTLQSCGARFVVLAACSAAAQASAGSGAGWIEGRVFLDLNRNGRFDAGEPPRSGTKVSNGRELVLSDADGRYRLPLRDGATLFVIRPPDADVPRGVDGLPRFWKHHFPAGSPSLRYGGIAPATIGDADFALLPATRRDPEEVVVSLLGDPQVGNARELDWLERDIIAP